MKGKNIYLHFQISANGVSTAGAENADQSSPPRHEAFPWGFLSFSRKKMPLQELGTSMKLGARADPFP